MKLIFAIALALLGGAQAACRNKCSGHGTCLTGDKCSCNARWVGLDCSGRECPYGISWVTSATTQSAAAGAIDTSIYSQNGYVAQTNAGLGGMHAYAECSGKGECDRGSGQCQCSDGYTGVGCRRTTCPNDCSNHGRCVDNSQINENYAHIRGGNLITQYWDAKKTFQCVCDVGYKGLDCSQRMCPKGDDPMINCPGPDVATQQDDIQMLVFENTAGQNIGETDIYGHVALTFTDMFGANYTTRPILLGAEATADASSTIKSALEALPNFVVPTATVNKIRYTSPTGRGHRYAVTFSDRANSGRQNTLQCSWAGEALVGDTQTATRALGFASAAPRLDSPKINKAGTPYTNFERACVVSHHYVYHREGADDSVGRLRAVCDRYAGAAPSFDFLPGSQVAMTGAWLSVAETASTFSATHAGACALEASDTFIYKEHAECSNRGTCDTSSGLCKCYEGFTGEACDAQTVFV